jgi:hypothetical protein
MIPFGCTDFLSCVGVCSEETVVFGYAVALFLTMMTIHDVAAAENDLVPTAGHKEQPETDPPFAARKLK